ncbi:MAG: hypothetical protein ACLQHK_03450 [Gallionellaceae bacterium]
MTKWLICLLSPVVDDALTDALRSPIRIVLATILLSGHQVVKHVREISAISLAVFRCIRAKPETTRIDGHAAG